MSRPGPLPLTPLRHRRPLPAGQGAARCGTTRGPLSAQSRPRAGHTIGSADTWHIHWRPRSAWLPWPFCSWRHRDAAARPRTRATPRRTAGRAPTRAPSRLAKDRTVHARGRHGNRARHDGATPRGRAMTGRVFCRYDLRTTDPSAAKTFYSEVVGLDFTGDPSSDESPPLGVWLLHEQARARGAPPHWLGHIGVTDVDATAQRLIELGSERLSPTLRANDGTAFATVRDPGGAVVAVRASTARPRRRRSHGTSFTRETSIGCGPRIPSSSDGSKPRRSKSPIRRAIAGCSRGRPEARTRGASRTRRAQSASMPTGCSSFRP